jgi:hypothetical protein
MDCFVTFLFQQGRKWIYGKEKSFKAKKEEEEDRKVKGRKGKKRKEEAL